MSSAAVAPRLTEAQFMRQVTELAEIRGWQWAHFRPAMTTKGWRTPVSGPLGKGWFDLVLVRDKRLLLVELKTDTTYLSPDQKVVFEAACMLESPVEVLVWRPKFWDHIEATLR